MPDYDEDWTEEQRALYDECYAIGQGWSDDPDTPSDELQEVINLAEADDDDLAGVDIDYAPLVDAVTEATGETATSVPARHGDPAFEGFVAGARDGAADDVFGL
nr:hypothetical protein [Micromonospora sp. DSM 115978]